MAWRFIDAYGPMGSIAVAIKTAGIDGVLRYIKNTTAEEVQALFAAGLMIGLIDEHTSGDALGGADQGAINGPKAVAKLAEIGAPPSVPIFATVDTDITEDNLQVVEDFFVAYDAAIYADGGRKIGGYADGTALTGLRAYGMNFCWLAGAMGWDGSRDFAKNGNPDLVQGPTLMHGGAWPPANLIPGIAPMHWPNLPIAGGYDPNVALNIKWAWLPPSLQQKEPA